MLIRTALGCAYHPPYLAQSCTQVAMATAGRAYCGSGQLGHRIARAMTIKVRHIFAQQRTERLLAHSCYQLLTYMQPSAARVCQPFCVLSFPRCNFADKKGRTHQIGALVSDDGVELTRHFQKCDADEGRNRSDHENSPKPTTTPP